MNRYSISQVDAGSAQLLWERSPYATVFTHPAVAARMAKRVDWWLCAKGAEPLCVWPVTCNGDGRPELPYFGYWIGPLWLRCVQDIPAHRALSETGGVYSCFIDRLLGSYGAVESELPVGLDDVRVFDWHNHGDAVATRFVVSPRYTAQLDELHSRSEEDVVRGYRELRRREIRKAGSDPSLVLTSDSTPGELVGLYSSAFARQGLSVEPRTLAQIHDLMNLAAEGYGETVGVRELASGRLTAAVLMLYAKGTANMVLNLTSPDARGSGVSAWAVHNAILRAKQRGSRCFDFNGANSPNRGDDKHSYGAVPRLYFSIRYPGP